MAENSLLLLVSFFFFLLPCFCNGDGMILPVPMEYANSSQSDLKTYIVHVRKPALMASADRQELETWHASFLPSPLLSSGEPRLVFSYEKALSGFAAKLTADELEAMASKPDFLYAYPDEALVPETTSLIFFLRVGDSGSLWPSSGLGLGTILGVIDSGINPNHVVFGDNLFPDPPSTWKGRCDLKPPNKCNKKLIGVRNFDAEGPQAEAIDKTGHGSFVANVAAGSNILNVSSAGGLAFGRSAGISPGSHLAIYRASSASGLVASFDEAIRDGVEVLCISMSLPVSALFQNDIAIAALSAVESGILVSAAAGNHGPRRGSARNVAPWLLTVGASTTDRALAVVLKLGDGVMLEGQSLQNRSSIPSGALRLSSHSSCTSPMQGVVGMAVLCTSDAATTPARQAENVLKSGGVAVIIMNDRLNGSTIVLYDTVLPTVFLTYQNGETLATYARSAPGGASVELLPEGTTFQAAPTPTVAAFSGRGPSTANGGIIKPDVVAPGVNILAADFTSEKDFVFNSGTSASAAIVAGASVMLKKINPDWSPAMIRSALMTSALHLDNEMNAIKDQTGAAGGAHSHGSGHVNAVRAKDPGLVYDIDPEDYLRYLCGMGYSDNEVDAVARRSVHCSSLGKLRPEELNYPSIAVVLRPGGTTVTRTVRNVGPDFSVYSAHVTGMPRGVTVRVDPEQLTFAAKGEEQSFTVSFHHGGGGAAHDQSGEMEGSLTWKASTSNHHVRTPLLVTLA